LSHSAVSELKWINIDVASDHEVAPDPTMNKIRVIRWYKGRIGLAMVI
jgi:hypothetical protein